MRAMVRAFREHVLQNSENVGKGFAEEARRMLERGEFGVGSMGPKVEAAAQFVEGGGKVAVICALRDAVAALAGDAGTRIAY